MHDAQLADADKDKQLGPPQQPALNQYYVVQADGPLAEMPATD